MRAIGFAIICDPTSPQRPRGDSNDQGHPDDGDVPLVGTPNSALPRLRSRSAARPERNPAVEARRAGCDKCKAAAAEYRQIDSALSRWAARRMPDPQSVTHMHEVVYRLVRGELK